MPTAQDASFHFPKLLLRCHRRLIAPWGNARRTRDLARGETNEEVASSPGERSESRFGGRPAHRVEHHVNTPAPGQLLDLIAPIRGARVDHRISPRLKRKPALSFARGRT